MHRSGTRAARRGVGITGLALLVVVACGRGGPEVRLGGEFGDASYADVVLDPGARPEWRSLREEPVAERALGPAAADAALDTGDAGARWPEVGEIEVILGTAGDRSEIPEDAIDRLDGGFQGTWVLEGQRAPQRLHVVLDAPYQSWADEGTFVHLVVLTPDFRPASGAEIYLFGRRIGTADEHGAFAFRREPTPGGMDAGQGLLVARHGGLTRRVRYDAAARTSSFEAVTIYGYTDRGIYEPGDTALFRAVAWRLRGEYVPYPDHDLEIELVDDDEQIVSGASVHTDEWGVAERTLPIPATLPDGPYRLRVRSGEEVAESRLVVQRFVPPVIAIEHDLPRYLARTREELTVNVSLRYFAGGTFERGHLALIAKRDDTELERVELDVTGTGPHAIALDAERLARIFEALGERSRQRATLALDLVATDPSGRTDTIHRFVDVVPNPYLVAVELDRTRYQIGDPVNVMVRATERDGVPVRDRDVVLQIGRGPRMTARTDESGVARFTFPMPATSAMLEVYLSDVREPVGHARLPYPESIPMLSAVESTVVESGAPIDVRVLFPADVRPVESVVHADVVDSSGAIIHSMLVPIAEVAGRPEARATVAAPSWGSMLLTLWCVARRGTSVGVVTDGQSLVVTPGETLTVTLGGLPEHARPGDEIDATIEVRDADGELHEAMLGVSVADRAVLSLLDPFERAPVDRFYNPERKVLASTGAQTLTWPWVSRTWGEDRMDIGWPGTFGFHAGRDPSPSTLEGEQASSFDALPATSGWFSMNALGGLMGDQIGASFGFGGLGLVGTGMGGGGTGEGTIGLGNLGTIGHGAGAGTGSGYGAGAGRLGGRGDELEEPPAAQPTTIVLRTEHDETSLWLPRLVAENGRAVVHARLPESITEQELSVLATDRTGGIALARVRVPVSQELFARSDLPPALVEGDVIEVAVAAENHGGEPVSVTLSLEPVPSTAAAPGEIVVEGEPTRGTIAPGGVLSARLSVRAVRPGATRYRVRASTGTFEDVDERELHIEPSGPPVTDVRTGLLDGRGAYRTSMELSVDDRFREVRLGVTFPTVAPAIAGVETLFAGGTWGPDPASSQVMGAAALYRYLVLTDQFDPDRDGPLVARLRELAARIPRAQGFDGGFGWYWTNGRSAPFITVHVLEAMLELRDVGLDDDEAIRRAAAYLVSTLREHGPLSATEVAPWVGADPWISISTTLEALHAIGRALPSDDPLFAIARDALLPPRLREVLDAASPDPLALAHGIAAGLWLGALDRDALRAAVPRLAEIREIAHWEPGWFDAWGGTVEAAATTLEVLDVLRTTEREEAAGFVPHAMFEGAARDAIRFILHTRGSFGAWHNTRATAWAIRALTRVAPGDPEDHGTLHVLVDGEERSAVEVRADDLFASALALRELDLSGLTPGHHELEVRYDGRSRPRVELEIRRWVGEPGSVPALEGARLERRLEERCASGGRCVVVTLPSELRFPALVEQPLGDTVEADRDALERMRSRGDIAWHEVSGDVLRIALSTRLVELDLPLRMTRGGRLAIQPTRASALAGGATWTSDAITVDEP